MELPHLVLEQRKTSSFNPEATAFSPTFHVVTPKSQERTTSPVAPPLAVPYELFDRLTALKHDSLLRPAEEMSPIHCEKATAPPALAGPEDRQSRNMSLSALQKMLNEHSTAMNQNRTATPLETALFSNTADSLMPRLSPFTFPLQGCERNFGTVNVDELNASLGLPGISKNSTMDESPIRSQTSRLPQRLPAEYARYLSSCKNVYPDEIITDSRDAQDIFMDSGKAEREEGRAMKIVRPPPGFRDETARNILIKETTSVPSVVMELKHRPASPAAIQNKLQSTPFRPANYVQYNVRGPSNRRRPRASTRVKRTDQGPEPSAADIYPEDANWEPSRMPFSHRERPQLGMPFVPHLAPKRDLYLDDVINWPTPAEVYMNKPPTPIPTPPLDVFENYVLPTVEDINAADDIVLGMIEQLPYVSYNTLLVFGASDTISDGCPLTPGQLDGNTYGMNFYGLALGDDWNPTVVQEGKPFHIRS